MSKVVQNESSEDESGSAKLLLDGITDKDLQLLNQYRTVHLSGIVQQDPMPKDMANRYTCTVCDIIVHDTGTWQSHVVGKKHQSNLNRAHIERQYVARPQVYDRHASPIQEQKPHQFMCTICGCELKDQETWNLHINGKRHKTNAERFTAKTECGVFVSGIPNQVKSEDLHSYFSTFGELVDFFHTPGRPFLMLQYKERQSAKNVLAAPICIHGRRVITRPRKPPTVTSPRREKFPPPRPENGINHEDVKQVLVDGGGDDFQLLVKELELPPGSDKKFEEVCRHLELVFRSLYPHCIACPFGSTVTGLGLKGSDLDVFLNTQEPVACAASVASVGDENETSSAPKPEELVITGRKLMFKNNSIFTNIIAVTRAKTPIIKFVHRTTKISCDVSFRNSFGVSNSYLIRFFISLDPRIRPYLMIIKYWARVHELSGSGKMSNYALVIKSLFFLQQIKEPIIPPVADLQSSYTDSDLVDGWLCKFDSDASHIKPIENKDSVAELLLGFFHYYAEFDYGGNVISPLLGKTINKSSFAIPDQLPNSLHLYKERKTPAVLKYTSEMCIQDPFDLTHNLTGALGAKYVSYFCSYCQIAAGIMENVLKESSNSKKGLLLIKLLDVNTKPPLQKYLNLNSKSMMLRVNVGQYLSLGFTLDGGSESDLKSNDEDIRNMKISKWYALVYEFLLTILKKVMKFTVKEESDESSSKVQKVEEPSDVHLKASGFSDKTSFPSKTYYCEGCYNLWDGRKKVRKALKLQSAPVLQIEETVSDILMENRYGKVKKVPQPILKFSCTFEPKLDPLQVTLLFHNKGSLELSFITVMSLLQARIPGWIESSMDYLKKEHLMKQNLTRPPAVANAKDV